MRCRRRLRRRRPVRVRALRVRPVRQTVTPMRFGCGNAPDSSPNSRVIQVSSTCTTRHAPCFPHGRSRPHARPHPPRVRPRPERDPHHVPAPNHRPRRQLRESRSWGVKNRVASRRRARWLWQPTPFSTLVLAYLQSGSPSIPMRLTAGTELRPLARRRAARQRDVEPAGPTGPGLVEPGTGGPQTNHPSVARRPPTSTSVLRAHLERSRTHSPGPGWPRTQRPGPP